MLLLVDAAPPKILKSYGVVSHGYGCGGNCAFNASGKSELTFTLSGDEVTLIDAGDLSERMSSPMGGTSTKTTFRSVWKGKQSLKDGAMELRLKLEDATCDREHSSGGIPGRSKPAEQPRPPQLPATLVLVCKREEVPLIVRLPDGPVPQVKPTPPPPAEAWICAPETPLEHVGLTGFPWVFGIERPLEMLFVGEPRAARKYAAR